MHMQSTLDLTQNQIQDLMFLRRAYLLRRLSLDRQRTRLMNAIQETSHDAIVDAMKASRLAPQIGDLAAQKRQLFHRFAWAIFHGVSGTTL